jgi:septum formation protein
MLKDKFINHQIILASGSPRRQQFFTDLDLDFEIRIKDTEEVYPDNFKAGEITEFLAKLKASVFVDELKENDILVTSDTIVWLENEALGKPENFDDAFNMLTKMSGKTHTVYTSVCIKTKVSEIVFTDETKVTFKNLSPGEITYYLQNYQPYDKAGSYGIQEWIGLVAIEKMEGSYTNVVGLPTSKLYQELLNLKL